MNIQSIKVERFKKITSVDVDLKDITILIGGNNAGKSSFLQGVHFGITAIQSADMAGGVSTLSVEQLIYKPANDPILLQAYNPMTQTSGPRFTFKYLRDHEAEVNDFAISLYRGKNANISVAYPRDDFYERARNRVHPLSIFVPGLAGIALREERRSEAILNTGIAQGDSNLYLRNVLLRIIRDDAKLLRFHETIRSLFPGLTISTDFDESKQSVHTAPM